MILLHDNTRLLSADLPEVAGPGMGDVTLSSVQPYFRNLRNYTLFTKRSLEFFCKSTHSSHKCWQQMVEADVGDIRY